MTLRELVIEYHKTLQEIKILETTKKDLKSRIDLSLSTQDTNKYQDSQYSAILSEHQRVKYDLEGIEHLLLHKGIPSARFLESKVDLKRVEELIAEGSVDAQEIAEYAEVKTIKTLTVKGS